MRILITDASYKHAVGLIRHLAHAGHTLFAVSHRRLAPGAVSRFTHRFVRVPDPGADAPGFCTALARLCDQFDITLVIPVGFNAVAAVISSDDLRRRSIVADAEIFARAADKWRMCEIAQRAGVGTPVTILAEDLDAVAGFLRGPDGSKGAVLKARRESMPYSVRHIPNPAALTAETTHAFPRSESGDPLLIAQAYVHGPTCGYFALADHGQVVREFMHRRLREHPPSGGPATAAVSIAEPSVAHAGRALIASLQWHGPAMCEFRVADGVPYLIEFNPKLWGSLELALAAGADFAGDLCLMRDGVDLSTRPMPDYQTGLRFWWPWRGDLRRLLTRPRDVGRVIDDLLDPQVRSNWWWSDPVPNILEIAGELTLGLRGRRR